MPRADGQAHACSRCAEVALTDAPHDVHLRLGSRFTTLLELLEAMESPRSEEACCVLTEHNRISGVITLAEALRASVAKAETRLRVGSRRAENRRENVLV